MGLNLAFNPVGRTCHKNLTPTSNERLRDTFLHGVGFQNLTQVKMDFTLAGQK